MEDEEEKGNEGAGLIDMLYDKCLVGVPGLSKPIEEFAQEFMCEQGGDRKKAIDKLVNNQIIKLSTTGFVSGLGGLITLPVSIPLDMSASYYVHIRMIAAIAYICGYDVRSDSVRTMSYATLVGCKVFELVKQVGIKTSEKIAMNALKKLPGKILTKINQKLGFRFITKAGSKGLVNLIKVIPIIPGIINGCLNGIETKVIAERAKKAFLTDALEYTPNQELDKLNDEEALAKAVVGTAIACSEAGITTEEECATERAKKAFSTGALEYTPNLELDKLNDEETLAKAVVGTAVACSEAGITTEEECATYISELPMADIMANIEKGNELFQKFLDRNSELDNEFNDLAENDAKKSTDMWNAINNI